jgi:SAM-dependent MidA family methyltransferase
VYWIIAEIRSRGGALPFRDYMELALYHPEHGYYSAPAPRYGRHGDFLTAPTASLWYAAVLGRCCRSLAARFGPVLLVDLASGDGSFIDRFITELGSELPGVLERVVSVERSEAMRWQQQERLHGAPVTITMVRDIAGVELGDRFVVLHACELYDALAVHRVVQREHELCELWVSSDGTGLSWCERPAPPWLCRYFESHGVELQPGQIAEANLAAGELHRRFLGRVSGDGMAIVLDYGYEARRLYNPRGRRSGSLACYSRHRLSRDPLAAPGEQDITAHVCWDDLRLAASDAGWHEVALLPLAELLVRGGLATEMEARGLGMEAELTSATVAARQEMKRLLDPEGMGADLKALIQATPTAAAAAGELLTHP